MDDEREREDDVLPDAQCPLGTDGFLMQLGLSCEFRDDEREKSCVSFYIIYNIVFLEILAIHSHAKMCVCVCVFSTLELVQKDF